MLNTPVLFIIFNREDTTQKVFDAIRLAQPKYLYVAADGPRKDRLGEAEKCEKTRSILEQIDWDCELKTLFRDKNLGCGKALSSAITWFFDNVEQGIILEDDCLPHPDFFLYCEQLLDKYKNIPEVKLISGTTYQNGIKRGDSSYYFSKCTHIWGWASWRRTWDEYDYEMKAFDKKTIKQAIKTAVPSNSMRLYMYDKYLNVKKHRIDTWDYQLMFSVWCNNGITIIPQENLISNIGFENATHADKNNPIGNLNKPMNSILPLIHPNNRDVDREADKYFYTHILNKSFLRNIIRFCITLFKR